jgi:hypothetical protein
MSRLRLPAYGRELADAQRRGLNVTELVIALSWSLGKPFPRVVVTDDHVIHELDLSIVKGLSCVVAHDGDHARALAVAMLALRCGATACPVIDVNSNKALITSEVIAVHEMKAAA